ncbi:unnamed protein product [Gadus morhua 'NCC']
MDYLHCGKYCLLSTPTPYTPTNPPNPYASPQEFLLNGRLFSCRWVPAGDCSPRPGSLENGAKHYSDRTPERAQNLAPDSLVTPRINDLEGCQQAGARQGDSGGQSMEEEVVG